MLILDYIQYLCDSKELDGNLRCDSTNNNIIGALYIPTVYEQKQNDVIGNLFHTNGFVTFQQGNRAGVSPKRLKECILEMYSHPIVLEGCIIHPDVIVAPLQVVVEECIDAGSFVDLSTHLHSDILSNRDDVRSILTKHILNKFDHANGCLVVDDHEAIYFSQAMINDVSNKVLPPIIEDFAKERAVEMADEIEKMKKVNVGTKYNKDPKTAAGKSKSKTKLSKKKKDSEGVEDAMIHAPNPGLIPLQTVVGAITEHCPDLDDIQNHYCSERIEPNWHQPSDNIREYEGPLYEFCRIALNKDSCLDSLCHKAVSAELEKIMASKKGNSLSARVQGAAKCRSIESQFEENFANACYFLQLVVKMMNVCSPLNGDEVNVMEGNILHHCACFARRITEYCLFKVGLDVDGPFCFINECDSDAMDENYYYSKVDFCQHHVPSSVFLSCTSTSETSDQEKEPLRLLRDLIPGNVGVEVARMWILTGANHYFGGFKPGDINKFIKHVEESCL